MAETIYNGYVINKQPYQVFDEIITFVIKNNNKITCLSRGSRKIESKNARHLFLGNYVEFQIFQSRSEEKLSKLKKAVVIKAVDWNFETLESFNLLNECVNKISNKTKSLFDFYQKHLDLITNQNIGEKQLILVILKDFIKISGTNLEVNHCVKCNNNKLKTISLKDHGMLCNLCFNPKHDKYYELSITKAIHHLFNDEYEKLNQYVQEFDFIIKLLRIYVEDNVGIKLITLTDY